AGQGTLGLGSPSSPFGALGSLAGPLGGGGAEAHGFWFNINAELIIYGATEPDANVTIGGRQIRLRPDGTFSYRFALPDGTFDLPAVATSAAGDDTRAAELRFRRQTAYHGSVGTHPQDASLKPPLPENVT
ncbi:MAG: Rho termination protein, partial [Verrucomicrobia bacterium]|nr:Rho termination protein [Verrucomicrobiota bacterium]